MMLTSNNKKRHAVSVLRSVLSRRFLNGNASLPNMYPVMRVGSTRTTDGAAFLMSDDKYVCKLLFYKGSSDLASIQNEFAVGKIMGNLGLSPKCYAMHDLDMNPATVNANLLSNRSMRSKHAIMIIMENLAKGAKKLESLTDYVWRTGKYPEKAVMALYTKMSGAGILHGDLHAGNIMVKTLPSGKVKLYIIDFGRSIILGPGVTPRTYVKNGSPYPGYPGYFITKNNKTVGLNNVILARNKKRLMAGGARIKTPSPSIPSVPKSMFVSPLPKSFFRSVGSCP